MTDNLLIKLNKGLGVIKPYMTKIFAIITAFITFIGTWVKKSEKKAKMHIRLIRLKNILEIISNIALIIASVIAVMYAIGEFIRRKDN